jgi:hypothetical protein
VTEVPGERAEDRRVDGVELLLAQRLHQQERAPAGLLETRGDSVGCPGLTGRRDPDRLNPRG